MTYETLRYLADSWGLVVLVAIFLFVVGFVFRPGSNNLYRRMSQLPLDKDRKDQD